MFWSILLWLLLSLLFSRPINLVTADLGRHLKNGQTILSQGLGSGVLNTNYYSYTHPQFPVINHHWGFGVMAQLIYRLGGFSLLSIFNSLLFGLAILLIIQTLPRPRNKLWLVFSLLLAWPLLISRTEVRPETISFLFVAIYWWLLTRYRNTQRWPYLIFLPLIQVIWTNTHIFFPLGWLVIGSFWLGQLRQVKNTYTIKPIFFRLLNFSQSLNPTIFFTLLAVILASLINPWTYHLLVLPFTIMFKNYNYLIVENQSPLFLWRLHVLSNLQIYVLFILAITSLATILKIIYLVIARRRLPQISPANILALAFGLGSWQMMRIYPYFGLFLMPTSYIFLQSVAKNRLVKQYWRKFKQRVIFWPTFSSILLIGLFLIFRSGLFIQPLTQIGWGLLPHNLAAAQFYRSLNLSGQIFNNYDIGGYLIFNLPDLSVWTDNRPEAYPNSFFDEYQLAQTNPDKFNELVQKYNINSIFFFRHDATPWGQAFLIEKSRDTGWVPIYVDDLTIIFVANTPTNQQIIKKYQLDRSIFGIAKT